MEEPNSSPTDDTESKCAICSAQTTKFCGNCHKIYYCSLEHQKSDRKRHKPTCFPIQIISSPSKGRCVLATRNIKAGELILKDEHLVCAPNGNVLCSLPEFRPMCLGCFRILSAELGKNYSCTSCGWPVCGLECEKEAKHANYECPIFTRSSIPPFTKAMDYDHIKILRALLLSETNPTKWEQLLNLESHETVREKLASCQKKTFDTVMFIRTTCGLMQYDYKTINYAVGVFRVNAFGNHNWPMLATKKHSSSSNGRESVVAVSPGFREGTFLFYLSSMFAHNCIPNTRSFLTQELNCTNSKSSAPAAAAGESYFMKHLLATIDIPSGNEICISYIETRQGTAERRTILSRGYHFACSCERCADPTEFGLFFSALKCQQCLPSIKNNNNEGYLLLKNPLMSKKSVWVCNFCGGEKCWEEVQNTIDEVQKRIEEVKKSSPDGDGTSTSADLDSFPQNVVRLGKLLLEYQDVAVHTNHWLMVELEYDIIKCCRNAFLECYSHSSSSSSKDERISKETLELWKSYLIDSVSMIHKMTKHCLAIGAVLRPGISIFRGCLLFSLAQCQFIQFEKVMKETGGAAGAPGTSLHVMKSELLKTVEEAKSILIIEPAGSEEWKIAHEMYSVIVDNVQRHDMYFLQEK